ncbi:MAG: MFS transporter [Acidimicrobiia bacterium]|nr:MFS transporter [Acidimicrobiia bacterium]
MYPSDRGFHGLPPPSTKSSEASPAVSRIPHGSFGPTGGWCANLEYGGFLSTQSEGQRWVVPLALTVMVGFGVILYGFPIYLTDHAAGSEFSKTLLSVAYGGSVFAGGVLALPVGRYADRHGIRSVIGFGAMLGAMGLGIFSVSTQPWHVVVAWWLFIGPAQAMVYYEPAYIAINQWSKVEDRACSLAKITLIGGLAGIIFPPLTERMVGLFGWRATVFVLAVLLITVGAVTSYRWLPRKDPRKAEQSSRIRLPIGALFADRRFVLYTVAMALMFLSVQGTIAHNVARFEEVGFSLTTVALWAAVASVMSLPGRWLAPIMAARLGVTGVQAAFTLIAALGVLLQIDGTETWQMIGHYALFGLAFGGLLPLRAMVMANWYGSHVYGWTMGVQWSAAVLVGAAGPALVGVIRDATGDYRMSVVLMTACFLVAMGAILVSGRIEPAKHHAELGGDHSDYH